MDLRLVGAVSVTVLLLLVLAIIRLAVLLVQIVTLRYTLTIGAVALTCWFVDSRRQRYARGFYSCSRVLQIKHARSKVERESVDDGEVWLERKGHSVTVAVPRIALKTHETVPDQLRKMAPPSETESEDDESESSGVVSVKEKQVSAISRHSMSFVDLRAHSSTADSDFQWRKATRPRSSSAASDSRLVSKGSESNSSDAVAKERKRRVPRRRADTGTTSNVKQVERSRRATFATNASLRKSNSEKLEDALRLDGYWIGDFRVQRRLVSRRNYANHPNSGAGERR